MFGLVSAGTTTALVFGSHFAPAVDALFTEAARVGLRVTTGLVVSDRGLPEPLLTTPERAYDESLALAGRWHGIGRARYAVTPRFSYSAGDEMLDACASVTKDVAGAWFTSHVNENPAEVAEVARLFVGALHYVDTYDRHGLLGERSVLAHNVHATDRELAVLAGRGAAVAHCPTSNSALGSGLFPLRRHVEHGVRVALGSDVGAGTGFSLFKEGLQAYFMQPLLGPEGLPLTPAHLLHLATRAGALALGLGDQVGDLSVGKQFDAVWVRPLDDDPLDVGLRHATRAEDALAKIFALGDDSDLADVWVGGDRIRERGGPASGAGARSRRPIRGPESPHSGRVSASAARRAAYAGSVRKAGKSSARAESTNRSRATSQWPAAKESPSAARSASYSSSTIRCTSSRVTVSPVSRVASL